MASLDQSVLTGNNSLWLGITVGTDDEMTPRVQLGSVPFAVQALTVPDGSVTTDKIAAGAVTAEKLAASAIGGRVVEGAVTRDLSSDSGDQVIAGLGFQPTALVVMLLLNGTGSYLHSDN